jgi:hypothetical protein
VKIIKEVVGIKGKWVSKKTVIAINATLRIFDLQCFDWIIFKYQYQDLVLEKFYERKN